jgi:hypothetical protein
VLCSFDPKKIECTKLACLFLEEGKNMIESANRKCNYSNLNSYCHLAKCGDAVEVTEWVNGEGYDIVISSDSGDKQISLTLGELRAITVLTNYE